MTFFIGLLIGASFLYMILSAKFHTSRAALLKQSYLTDLGYKRTIERLEGELEIANAKLNVKDVTHG